MTELKTVRVRELKFASFIGADVVFAPDGGWKVESNEVSRIICASYRDKGTTAFIEFEKQHGT